MWNISQNILEEVSAMVLENSQFLGNIPPKYVNGVSTIVLENFQFLGNIPQSIWEKYSPRNLGEIH